MSDMEAILQRLQSFESADVFNPWATDDPLDAWGSGAAARRDRLRAHFDCRPEVLLVGEAPGYQGCHFSGVAFTNEKLIMDGAIPRVTSAFRLTTRERPWCEPSETIVWRTLKEVGIHERAILWNAFAWHPHKPGDFLSNRTPTRSEVAAGIDVLRMVISHFAGVRVIPVGLISAKALAQLGVPALAPVRHPAMGGATAFREGLLQHLGA